MTVCRKMLSGRRMPSSSANFSAGMILPRAMPAMSGNDRLDLGDAVIAKELLYFGSHKSPSFSVSHCASTKDAARSTACAARCAKLGKQRTRKIIARDPPFRMPLQGQRKRGARSTRNASMTPSGARASTASPCPSSRTPWLCRELTLIRSVPARRRSKPPGSRVTSCAGPYCCSSGCFGFSR